MNIETKKLPSSVQTALKSTGYKKNNVDVKMATSINSFCSGSAGSKGYFTLLDLDTGKHRTEYGSWGGSNMFVQGNVVDDGKDYNLPPSGVGIVGSTGHYNSATIHIHPDSPIVATIAKVQSEVPELSERSQKLLAIHRSVKGGKYRKEALQRTKASESELSDLVASGYLKQNKAGSRQITPLGRNACADYNGSCCF